MNSRNVELYKQCRELFKHFSSEFVGDAKWNFSENKDTLALELQLISSTNSVLHFYYVFGNSDIVASLNDEMNIFRVSNQRTCHLHMTDLIEEFLKHGTILATHFTTATVSTPTTSAATTSAETT